MSGPFLSTVRRPRRRARRALVVLALVVVLVAVLAVAFGAIALLERSKLPRGTTIAGVDVGGSTESEARVAVARAAAARLDLPIRLVGAGGALAATSGRELRARPLVADAVAEADHAGSLARVLARVGLRHGRQVELAFRLGPVAAATLADRLDDRFGDPWRDARVDVADESIRVVEARPGTGVDRKALRRSLRTLPTRVQLRIVTVRPVVSSAEATAAASRVEGLLDGPRRVRFRDTDATLTRRRLRSLVRTEPEDGVLAVSLEPKGLGASLRVKLGRFEVAPRNASYAVGAAGVRVVPSRPGRTLDVERIGRSLVSDLASTTHLARFASTSPALTTEDAEKLDIRERVSEFTTYYSCCQPRVTNIQRAAQMLDGTIVEPGESFSLNDALGKRTVERGFVSAPQIFDGRLEDAVGGGISQVATTLYNAAFFAGVKLVAHQAHQFYISRYPMGREATVSWGGPELVFSQRLAGGDPHEGGRDRLVDQRPLLLPQARTARGDDDGRAVRFHAARDDPDAELRASSGNDEHRPVGGRVRVHGAVHAEGVPGVEAPARRALHRSLRPAERDRRSRSGAPPHCAEAQSRRSLPSPGASPRWRWSSIRASDASWSTCSVVCVMSNSDSSRRSISRRRPWQSSPRPTRTWAASASKPDVIRHTCRSWTLDTPGTETIACATAPASISGGVSSIRIAVESRRTLHALATISSAIATETIGSTTVQPVARMTTAATRTPAEPSRSAITWRSAASTFRLSPSERRRITAEIPFTARPASATTSIQPPRISGGFRNR